MSAALSLIRSEPVLILGGVQASLALGAAFGLHLTGEQVGALVSASAALLSIVCRQAVSPAAPPKV